MVALVLLGAGSSGPATCPRSLGGSRSAAIWARPWANWAVLAEPASPKSVVDFSTPDESLSGFLDGMGLAILTGTGWRALRETVPGYRAVAEENVVLVGVRDAWDHEAERLEESGIVVVPPAEIGVGLEARLDALRERVAEVYLHLDLDVLDRSEGMVNIYSTEGGPSASDVAEAIHAIGARFRIRSAAMTAYDPSADPEGRVAPTAVRLLVDIAKAAA